MLNSNCQEFKTVRATSFAVRASTTNGVTLWVISASQAFTIDVSGVQYASMGNANGEHGVSFKAGMQCVVIHFADDMVATVALPVEGRG